MGFFPALLELKHNSFNDMRKVSETTGIQRMLMKFAIESSTTEIIVIKMACRKGVLHNGGLNYYLSKII